MLRVYEPSNATLPSGLPVTACLVGRRVGMTLIPAPPPHARPGPFFLGAIGKIALAGPVVAYVIDRLTGVDTSSSELVVADVATRRVLRSAPVGYSVDAGILAYEALTALVVTSDGAVAWVEEQGGARSASVVSVYAAPAKGAAVLLDEGPAIDPTSLVLSGGTLSWSDAGAPRTGAMP
jgi:hypothetical protein